MHRAGQLDAAIGIYRDVLKTRPRDSDAHHLLGVVSHQKGEHRVAVDSISQAISLNPTVADYHTNLGSAQQALGNLDAAIRALQEAIALDAESAPAHNNLANVLKQQGRASEALEHYERCLELDPSYADAHSNYGAALIELRELDRAQASLERALELDPSLVTAQANLAVIQARRGERDAAISTYLRILKQQPRLATTWKNLGNLLSERGQAEDARAAYSQAAEIMQAPLYALRAATCCPVIPQSNAEIESFRKAFQEAVRQFEGVRLTEEPDDLVDSNCHPSFYVSYQGRDDRALRAAYANLFRDAIPRLEHAKREGPTHVSFVLSDRREAGFCRFLAGILTRLATDDMRVSVACSAQSKRALVELMGSRAANLEYVTIPRQLSSAARAIRDAKPDVLFHFEVGTDSFSYFLPFFQAAPVQCTSWGIPVTTGIPSMQYFVSSELLEPKTGEDHYSEQLVRLPTLPVYYERPQSNSSRRGRADWGISDREHVYLCPQSLFKLHPEFDTALAEILRTDPDGRIVLVAAKEPYWNELLNQRLQKSMPDVAQRIAVLPRLSQDEFVSALQWCDVMLDPFHFGGGATTYEALAVGTPIVTLPGKFMRGRVTSACYQKMGIDDCVANSVDNYVSLAVKLSSDRGYRNEVSSRIRSANDVLYDDMEAVQSLAAFLHDVAIASR